MVTRVCVSVCVSVSLYVSVSIRGRMPAQCTDPDVALGSGVGDAALVVHYWADLQSVHGLRCYGNITRTRNVSEYMLVLALCQVLMITTSSCNSILRPVMDYIHKYII